MPSSRKRGSCERPPPATYGSIFNTGLVLSGLLALATWVLWGLPRPELGVSVPETVAAVFIPAAMILLALDMLKGHF